jgi:hypothetical protein
VLTVSFSQSSTGTTTPAGKTAPSGFLHKPRDITVCLKEVEDGVRQAAKIF